MEAMSDESDTAIISVDLGAVAEYEPHAFPFVRYDGPSTTIRKGTVLLSLTLEEMARIKELGIDLSQSHDFLYNTRLGFEDLVEKRTKLLEKQKTLNPFKLFLNYRAARGFHAAASALYHETKNTSASMQEEHKPKSMQSVRSAEMCVIKDLAPAGERVGGIAVRTNGKLDEDALRTIQDGVNTLITHASDSFVNHPYMLQLENDRQEMITSLADTDAASLQLLSRINEPVVGIDETDSLPDAATMSPSSPQTINININSSVYSHSILTTNSNATGLTINHGSSNSGASVSQ